MDEKIRAFISLPVSDLVIKEIARIQEIILKKKFVGKVTELENLHLTLKFLGEISKETLVQVKTALSKISFHQFKAKLLKAGTFSYRGAPKIVWLKIGGKEIHELQKQIDLALKDFFKLEARFMSHMTIARVKYVADKIAFKEFIAKLPIKKISFEINSFELRSSELKPLGPIYTTLQEYFSISSSPETLRSQ